MKFSSLKNLLQTAVQVAKRFPFEVLFALTGTIAAITYIEISNINLVVEAWSLRIIMVANLGLLISLSTTLFAESRGIKKSQLLLFKLITALSSVSLIFIINPFEEQADYIRFFLLSVAFHLLVAFAPFIKPDHIQGFWQFNKTLFLRFLTSLLYSTALYAGIAAAIGAMNFLFNYNFEWDTFVILWICITGIFNTIFFLAGIPGDLSLLNQDFSYPKGLKIFTQYVLIPLATLYVVILLAYEIKILVEWNLPKGLVSKLILGYAVFGILSLLLIFPIRGQAENKWIKTYSRSFYFLMLPLIVLLFLAVGSRIFTYGITVYRYFLIVLAFWLLFITVYFLTAKRQNIKLIPISLCILILLSSYGPQSAFYTAMYSQRNVLINIFKRNHLFEQGTFKQANAGKLSAKEGNRASNTLYYLINNYDINVLQPYLKKDINAVSDSLSKTISNAPPKTWISKYELRSKKEEWLKKYLGLDIFSPYHYDAETKAAQTEKIRYNFDSEETSLIQLERYDFLIPQNGIETDTTSYQTGNLHIQKIMQDDTLFSIDINGERVIFNLKTLATGLLKNKVKAKINSESGQQDNYYKLPPDSLTLKKETKKYIIQFKIKTISLQTDQKDQVSKILYTTGDFLIKIK